MYTACAENYYSLLDTVEGMVSVELIFAPQIDAYDPVGRIITRWNNGEDGQSEIGFVMYEVGDKESIYCTVKVKGQRDIEVYNKGMQKLLKDPTVAEALKKDWGVEVKDGRWTLAFEQAGLVRVRAL